MIVNPAKLVNMPQLIVELQSANFTVTTLGNALDANGLTTELHSYALDGTWRDLPTGCDAVVANHVAQIANTSNIDLINSYQLAFQRLSDIIANGNAFTQVQALSAIVDEARILRRIMRLLYGMATNT